MKKLVIILLMFSLVACSSKYPTRENEGKVKSMFVNAKFYIGGFGRGYHVKIINQTLSYADDRTTIKKHWQKRALTNKEILDLEKMFINSGASEWNREYSVPWVQDGTQWLIKYKSSRVEINSMGSNSYPSNFKRVLSYISKNLLKGKTFQ